MGDGRRVLICAVRVPFVFGGAELLVQGLERAVRGAGYEVDTMSLPYAWDPPDRIIESAGMWRAARAESPAGKIDLALCTKFPSYAVSHPNKVAWVLHQHRGAYDLAGTIYDDIGRHPGAERLRERIRELDMEYLSECRKVFSISGRVSGRMSEYCGIESEPVYHPPPLDGRYRNDGYGDDVLVVGRLEPLKRVDLLINAMKEVRNPRATLRVVGRGFLLGPLVDLARREGVSHRVRFDGFVSDEELISMYASCGCVAYVPYEEDYGYSVLEAFKSRKPVVVTDDSGGPLEFVRDRVNGRVVPAAPAELGAAIDGLLSDRRTARRLGETGYDTVKGISWADVLKRIVEPFA